MPPKSSNKKNSTQAASWYSCDSCHVHITSKERETHAEVCPIGENVFASPKGTPLEYISNGVLHTASVERRSFAIEELNEMPMKFVNNMLFVSEGAMKLANFCIGEHVLIEAVDANETEQPTVLVRSLWPIPEKFLTTVFVSDKDYKTNWQPIKGKTLRIQSIKSHSVVHAKVVQLQLEQSDDFTAQQLQDMEQLLRIDLKQLIYTNQSLIHYNFFNKTVQLRVTSWHSFARDAAEQPVDATSADRALQEALENLSLKVKKRFFKFVAGTAIQIQNPKILIEQPAKEEENVITKEDIGGLSKEMQIVEETMNYALGYTRPPKGVKVSRAMLLHGPTGCGKTMVCETMKWLTKQQSIQTHVVTINTSEIFSKFLGETEKNLNAYFNKAYANYPQPTLLILEDVHNVCPKNETNEVIKRVSVSFLTMLDDLSTKHEAQRIFLLATTSQIDSLNPNIRRCGRIDSEIEIGLPNPMERLAILKCLLRKVDHYLNESEIEEIAQVTHGYVGADLANLVYSAMLQVIKSNTNGKLDAKHMHKALTHVKPSAMREVLIECPNVHWCDIGGQDELKYQLQQAIEWPLLHPDKFKRLGIRPPRGILMFGPPGCSKTMIAKALATESKLNFLSVKGPELFSMWVGESERAVRDIFRKARQVAPAIVFFDEIDAISGERAESGGGSSVKERVLTQLLTELDGVESLENVTIVAATNRPDMIDKALLRPGRIDRIIYVGLPNAAARRDIFNIKLKAMPVAADVDIDLLVQRTEGYTGAEIQAVCQEAALKTLEISFDSTHVQWAQFEYALTAVRPRTSKDLLQLYDEYMKKT